MANASSQTWQLGGPKSEKSGSILIITGIGLFTLAGTDFAVELSHDLVKARAKHFVPLQMIVASEAFIASTAAKTKQMLAYVFIQDFNRFELF